MAHPVYVLLPDGVEWPGVPATTAQGPAPVRWYLRQSMPTATTQVAVLVPGDEAEREQRIARVVRCAQELGGVALDGATQQVIEPGSTVTAPG